jgi:dTDP-4-dehydrorhamnose reductase
MKVLVIGASGLVGSHCLKYFKEKNIEVIGTYRNFKTDDTVFFDPFEENCFNFLEEIDFKPEVIIHCGALTNVDYCEDHQKESENQTLTSTEIIAEYCKKNNSRLVYISTDYVFDGLKGPYSEDDKTNPINVYGKHKLEAELVADKIGNCIIARVTNVYGEEERSKNFIANLLNLINSDSEKNFNLPFDQFATPIYAGDIAKMIYLLVIDNKKGIYNLSSTDYYNRYQLAQKVKSYFKKTNHIILNPISTKSLNQKAKRPLNGGLINIKFAKEYPHFVYTNVDAFILKIIKNGI